MSKSNFRQSDAENNYCRYHR